MTEDKSAAEKRAWRSGWNAGYAHATFEFLQKTEQIRSNSEAQVHLLQELIPVAKEMLEVARLVELGPDQGEHKGEWPAGVDAVWHDDTLILNLSNPRAHIFSYFEGVNTESEFKARLREIVGPKHLVAVDHMRGPGFVYKIEDLYNE